MLEIGTKAPEFVGVDENGNEVSLNDFKGKKLVLYFYPKDSTPGCTAEAFAPPMTSIAAISNNLNLLIFFFNFSRCKVTAGIHNISHPRRTDKITK